MMDWFEKDMAQSQAKWKFVYLHRPGYNVGGHRSHWGHPAWPALFRKYKADIIQQNHKLAGKLKVTVSSKTPTPVKQLISLDAFRGWTMFWIVGGELSSRL